MDNPPETFIDDPPAEQLLGKVECLLGQIVGARGRPFERKLAGPSSDGNSGQIEIRWEVCEGSSRVGDILVLQMEGVSLAAKDGPFGKSDPYLVFKRRTTDGSTSQIHKTEVSSECRSRRAHCICGLQSQVIHSFLCPRRRESIARSTNMKIAEIKGPNLGFSI